MTPERIERPSDHRGVLLIQGELLQQLAPEITLDAVNTQGQLRDTGIFALLRERLLLPDTYTIVAVIAQHFGYEWGILVESPELPYAGDFSGRASSTRASIWFTVKHSTKRQASTGRTWWRSRYIRSARYRSRVG